MSEKLVADIKATFPDIEIEKNPTSGSPKVYKITLDDKVWCVARRRKGARPRERRRGSQVRLAAVGRIPQAL